MDFPFDRQPPVHMPLAYGEVELTKKTDKGRFQKRKRTVEGKEEEEEEEEQEDEKQEVQGTADTAVLDQDRINVSCSPFLLGSSSYSLLQEVISSSGAVVGYSYDPVNELSCTLTLKVSSVDWSYLYGQKQLITQPICLAGQPRS